MSDKPQRRLEDLHHDCIQFKPVEWPNAVTDQLTIITTAIRIPAVIVPSGSESSKPVRCDSLYALTMYPHESGRPLDIHFRAHPQVIQSVRDLLLHCVHGTGEAEAMQRVLVSVREHEHTLSEKEFRDLVEELQKHIHEGRHLESAAPVVSGTISSMADLPGTQEVPQGAFILIIDHPAGLHARPSLLFAEVCKKVSGMVNVWKRDDAKNIADGKSVLQLLSLGAGQGSVLIVQPENPDCDRELLQQELQMIFEKLEEKK